MSRYKQPESSAIQTESGSTSDDDCPGHGAIDAPVRIGPPTPPPPTRLLDQVRDRIRRLGFAKRTEVAYVGWIRRFILANGKRHPRDMGGLEVELS